MGVAVDLTHALAKIGIGHDHEFYAQEIAPRGRLQGHIHAFLDHRALYGAVEVEAPAYATGRGEQLVAVGEINGHAGSLDGSQVPHPRRSQTCLQGASSATVSMSAQALGMPAALPSTSNSWAMLVVLLEVDDCSIALNLRMSDGDDSTDFTVSGLAAALSINATDIAMVIDLMRSTRLLFNVLAAIGEFSTSRDD